MYAHTKAQRKRHSTFIEKKCPFMKKNNTSPHSHRFVLQIELSNQLPVVSWINYLPTNEELNLGMCSISFDPVEDATPNRADCIISVWPDIQVIYLTPLVGETDD